MSTVLSLLSLLLVIAIANLGSSDGSGAASPQAHAHALAVLEQQPTSLENSTAIAPVDSNKNSDSCIRKCGNVSIDYPFGLSAGCALTPHFQLECTDNSPFLTTAEGYFSDYSLSRAPHQYYVNSFQVLNITPGYMIIKSTTIKAGSCSDGFDWTNQSTYGNASIQLPPEGPFRITRDNVFFASGCYAQGFTSSSNYPFDVDNPKDLARETGICGPTACEVDMESDPYAYCNDYRCSSCASTLQSSQAVYVWGGGYCGFASVLHPPTFTQAEGDPRRDGNVNYGLQLLWTLQVDGTEYPDCSTLRDNMSAYACSPNANCTYVRDRYVGNADIQYYTGYFCECTRGGYKGDGYINGTGCEDVDECAEANLCNKEQGAKCTNLDGNYTCSCPGDLKGDGRTDGSGCKKSNTAWIAGLSAGVFLFVILNSLVIWYIYWKRQKDLQSAGVFDSADFSRRDFLLEIQSKGGANICKLFTYDDLQKATNNFSPIMELGTGGFGTVFEGTLDDGTKLAIKKAKHNVGGGHNDTKQFINEVTVLSQVNHRNLVKLLGCCLETAVPVLVYEFIPNGNLFEHLRRGQMHFLGGRGVVDGPENKLLPSSNTPPLNWNNRLKIAIGTAEALTYLHSGTSPPIFHRDVKTANILLDEKYNAKVADFGLSKFVPVEATHLSTAVQGTPGYLDPEYFDNWQITNKSDVYSFGVVLLELVTAEKPVDLSRQAGDQNLALRCNRLMKHGRLEDIIDPVLGASSDPKMLAVIHGVASVAMKCVERLRDDRPSMGEVLEELQSLRRPRKKEGSGFGKSVLGKSRSLQGGFGKLHIQQASTI